MNSKVNKRKSEESEIVRNSSPVKQQCIASNVCETEKILRQLSLLFPEEQFLKRVPRVVMKHMIYSRILNRTVVDKEIDELTQNGIVRLFKLGSEEESLAVLLTDQYIEIIKRRCSDLSLTKKFVNRILEKIKETTVEKEALLSADFSEENIKTLIHDCLLTVRTTNTYWFCFPGAGEFMKMYVKGRQSVLAVVKKSKYQQILEKELELRKMKKTVHLGVYYHIHDIIGADLVTCINTTSGNLLRLSK